MMSPHLPSVLQQSHGNSISTERALKNIRCLLLGEEELFEPDGTLTDRCAAALDDVETMLGAIQK